MSENVPMFSVSWSRRIRHVTAAFFNTIFPPVCIGCQEIGTILCPRCVAGVTWLRPPVCQQCGLALQSSRQPTCAACRQHPIPLPQIRAAVLFADPIPRLIHHMKYKGAFALAAPLADLMVHAWPQWQLPLDLVIPVPLHPERKRKRGYNQAELLAQHICHQLGFPINVKALQRSQNTRPQVGLKAAERQKNVEMAFTVDPDPVKGRQILLIDDVCTTGATLAAAATVLQQAGARRVSGYCLARAI